MDSHTRKLGFGGRRIGMLSRLQFAMLDRRLEKYGITSGQLPVILGALILPGLPQDELSSRLGLNPATTARALRTLEQKGFISREDAPDNRRRKLVLPTAEAREIEGPLRAVLDGHNEMLFKNFSGHERVQALELMDRMVANLKAALESWDN